jgi:hypothetical protein
MVGVYLHLLVNYHRYMAYLLHVYEQEQYRIVVKIRFKFNVLKPAVGG